MAPRKNTEKPQNKTPKVKPINDMITRSKGALGSAVKKKNELPKSNLNMDTGGTGPRNTERAPPRLAGAIAAAKINDMTQILAFEDNVFDSDADSVPPVKKSKPNPKEIKNDIKIMLANEVVRNAFQKKEKPAQTVAVAGAAAGAVAGAVASETKRIQTRGRPKTTNCKATNCSSQPTITSPGTQCNDSTQNAPKNTKDVVNNKIGSRKRCATVPSGVSHQQEAKETNEVSATDATPKKRGRPIVRRRSIRVSQKPVIQRRTLKKKAKEDEPEMAPVHESTPESVAPIGSPEVDLAPGNAGQARGRVGTRKNSVTSTSTCLSWTKDISISSAVTCVTVQSNDFVRIDKKLPVVKLTNMNHKVQPKHTDDIFDDSSCTSDLDESASLGSSISVSELNITQPLNLSTSSLTSAQTNRTNQDARDPNNKTNIMKNLRTRLNKLLSDMKSFDLEMINWIRYDNECENEHTDDLNDRILYVLKEENEVMNYCKAIKELFISVNDSERSKNINEQTASKPISEANENVSSEKVEDDARQENEGTFDEKIANSKDDNPNDSTTEPRQMNEQRKSFDKELHLDNTEDDDAISLFAESISGWEMSKRNVSASKSIDGDNRDKSFSTIPAVKVSIPIQERICSSNCKIDGALGDKQKFTRITKGICEKQSADSSSICKQFGESIFPRTHNKSSTLNLSDLLKTKIHVQNNVRTFTTSVPANSIKHFSDSQNNNDTSQFNVPVNFNRNFPNLQNFTVRKPVAVSSAADKVSNKQNEVRNVTGNVIFKSPTRIPRYQEIDGKLPATEIISCDNIADEHANIERENSVGADNSSSHSTTERQFNSCSPVLIGTDKGQSFHTGSAIFNCCVFNLNHGCKKKFCPFPHIYMNVETVKAKLQELSEEVFVKECGFMLNWLPLRRRFAMCFVEECVRRDLTRLLLHVTIDNINRVNSKNRSDVNQVVEVIETALLHLNNANLEPCADLLRAPIATGQFLCDHLMTIISETQNFSRFKNVFIKLTLFMCQIGRQFALNVATHVMERLCILPYDNALACALMQIIQTTDPAIFSASRMGLFEMQLSVNNAQLYKQLIALKQQAGCCNVLPPAKQSPCLPSQTADQPLTPAARADSPDTTNMDAGNNTPDQGITRTIVFNASSLFNGSDSSTDCSQNKLKRSWRKFSPCRTPVKCQRPRLQYQHSGRGRTRPYNGGAVPKFRRPPDNY